jgi:hypothetical protein
MRLHVANFANFVCRFGGKKVLLDYAKEIVLPAFTDDKLVRSYGETDFFFYEVKVEKLGGTRRQPLVGVTGRFIKNTQLVREQIFDQRKGIVHDEAALASAPSVFFILILNDHRLIYYPETAHAPNLKTFQATALFFLKRKHREFIDSTYEALRARGEPATKKNLREVHPEPTLEVVPISGEE